MTERKEFFGMKEIYCKRNIKDCRYCFDTRCLNRTEKYSYINTKKHKQFISKSNRV